MLIYYVYVYTLTWENCMFFTVKKRDNECLSVVLYDLQPHNKFQKLNDVKGLALKPCMPPIA